MTPLDLVQRYVDAWNRHDAAAITDCLSPDGTYSDPTAGTLSGPAIGDYADALVAAFPDLRFDLGWVDAVGELVIVEWSMRGTNHGSFAGAPPTGRAIDLPGVDIITVGDKAIRSVQGYFDQRTLVDQLGLQVIVQPHSVGPFTFGRATRVQSGNLARPGALSMTWIDVCSEEECGQVIDYSRQIAIDMLRMPGFISWIGINVGNRLYTLTAWENVGAVEELLRNDAHRSAVKQVFSPDFATAIHTGVWDVHHLNPLRVRCPGCGQWADSACPEETCGCGARLPEPPPYL